MSKRHHRLSSKSGVKAVQTPRKPAETVTTPASNEDEKEAYPFEAIQRLCVRSFRSSSSLVYYAGVDIVSIFDEERDQSVSSPKAIKTETISFLKP